MTTYHVYEDLVNAMRNSTAPVEHKKIKVWFNHIVREQSVDVHEVVVNSNTIVLSREVDYALLQLEPGSEWSYLHSLSELGAKVRGDVPDDGFLTIIGHLDGREKMVKSLIIVSKYLWRDEVLKTVQHRSPPAEGFDKCLISCQRVVMNSDYDHKIAYAGTMLTCGAGGSPCFDESGHVIAMHTNGFFVNTLQQRVSIMEFGVPFSAIHADLKQRGYGWLANVLFPEMGQESAMDIH